MSNFNHQQSLLGSNDRLYPSLESRSYSTYSHDESHAVSEISTIEIPSRAQENVVIRVAANPASSSSTPGETGASGVPYVAETVPLRKTCCRSSLLAIIFGLSFLCMIPMVSWIIVLTLVTDVRDELVHDIRLKMVGEFLNSWMETIVDPSMKASGELQQQLSRSFPQLYSNSITMSQLQTDDGWLSSFSNVAARYPQFSSFGLQSADRFNSSANQLFIQYAKNSNTTTHPFQVRLSSDNNQQLMYTPTASSAPSGTNQLFPADIYPYDTPATIAKYLGQPTVVASNFDVRTTPEYAFASTLNFTSTSGSSFAWMGIQNDQGQPRGTGLNFVAAASSANAPPAAPTSPSALWLTQISTNTVTLYNLLATIPNVNSHGGAYICSTTGWILASTTGYSDYDLHNSPDAYLQYMGDFLSDNGLLQSEASWNGPLPSGVVFGGNKHVGGKGGVTYSFTATILPTYTANMPAAANPKAPQLFLYFVTVNDQFVDNSNYNNKIISSCVLCPFGFGLMAAIVTLFSLPFARVLRTVEAVIEFYTNPSGLTASENLRKTLLSAVKGWSKESISGRVVPPRTAQVIRAYLPAEKPEPGRKHGTLEFPIILSKCWYRKFGEIITLNDFVERYLYTLTEAETIKCYPTEDAFNFAAGLANPQR